MQNNCIAKLLTWVSIYGVYGSVFLLAGWSKVAGKTVPDWFQNQFGNSPLKKFPGLPVAYWSIAVLELTVPVLLVVSLARCEFGADSSRDFLHIAVSLASVIFLILGFGQRLTNDFVGAANSFFYFAGTLVTQAFLILLRPS